MTANIRLANGVAPHFDLEPFSTYAEPELTASPLHMPGVCFNPACSRDFVPARQWAQYCCRACADQGKAEFRSIGHKAALPLLIWRAGKYASLGTDEADRTRAARRYITRLQSEWLDDRRNRMARALT